MIVSWQKGWPDYLHSILPLIGGMLVIPLDDQRKLPPLLQSLYYNSAINTRRDFTFSREAVNNGRWYTAITYVFHHQDVNHLTGNLLGLVIFGRPVYYEIGPWGLNAIFFMGSIFAALDGSKKDRQFSKWFKNVINNPFPSSWTGARDVFDNISGSVTGWVTASISPHVQYIGASAGVFSLVGADTVIQVERFVQIIHRHQQEKDALKTSTQLASVFFNLYLLSSKVFGEYQLYRQGEEIGVDHAGHVDGYLIGAACYAAIWSARILYRYYKKKANGSIGNRLGGRSLGI